jgi:hypothetical protein
MSTEWIAPKGWKAPEPKPAPEPLTKEQVKQALAEALVPVMRGEPLPVAKAAEQVAGAVEGACLLWSEVVALVREIASEWAAGKGPDVDAYVPPPPPPPPEPVVIEEPTEPDPKEVP